MKKILLPLLASLLLIPACGGGDSDDGLKALADAIESEIENDEEADFLSGKGACIADKAIAYGAEELKKNGITLETIGDDIETLPEGGQEIVINSTLDCITASDVAEGIMQGAAEEGEPISMEAALCYAENMSREEWRVIISGPEEDSEEAGAIFLGLIADCPQLLVEIFMDDMGIDRSTAECVVEALSGPLLSSLASVGEGEEPDMEDLEELFMAFIGCGVDPEMMG
ncbi:MAG: hypothetical protein CL404_06260 [Acidimicrobiaceae bacterium]|nr:hypothetical protein [Acidimicrobiaceae bacterium]|tara:strand:+ start:238 stop:921 length:684 start_codon:yes stop_codon:yes gene_type:complete